MENKEKFVEFGKYCSTCKHSDENESDPESKCWDCLTEAVNTNSHKPVYWEEKE